MLNLSSKVEKIFKLQLIHIIKLFKNDYVFLEYLLLGIIFCEDSAGTQILIGLDAPLQKIRNMMIEVMLEQAQMTGAIFNEKEIKKIEQKLIEIMNSELLEDQGEVNIYDEPWKSLLSMAEKQSEELNQSTVGTEHLLLALIDYSENIRSFFNQYQISSQNIIEQIFSTRNSSNKSQINSDKVIHIPRFNSEPSKVNVEMMIFGLSPRAERILRDYSFRVARAYGDNEIVPEHILMAILKGGEGLGFHILNQAGVPLLLLKSKIEEFLLSRSKTVALHQGVPEISNHAMKSVIQYAKIESEKLGSRYIGSEHLLLAVLHLGEVASVFFQDHKITANVIYQHIHALQAKELASQRRDGNKKDGSFRSSLLEHFTQNMSEAARKGKYDPVIGRDKEIDRLIQVLSRRKKNNPILIGDPGVGKTSIIEGLAQKIEKGEVPDAMKDQTVLAIDLLGVIAGTKYRGEFEDRLKKVLKEIKKFKRVIIFIDEIHTIVGAGASEGSLDVANILKPELSRGEIQVIGSTTMMEYKKYIEKDSALERRFQSIIVREPNDEECIQILHKLKKNYEDFHQVIYDDESIRQAVILSRLYIPERFFPDKAIDVLDEAGASVRLKKESKPEIILQLEKEIKENNHIKTKYTQEENFKLASEFRDKVIELDKKLIIENEKWAKNRKNLALRVQKEDVLDVIARITNISLDYLKQSSQEKLMNLASSIKNVLFGQDDVVDEVVKMIRRSYLGLHEPNRPILSLLLVGPTGIGKTELAKQIAKGLFGEHAHSMLTLDMSDFMEKHSVSRLVGAPPGYIGSENGGILSDFVRRNPHSLILFDEVEKAHPDVYNLLLQVLGEATLVDSLGFRANFRNTIIIFTSNAGTTEFIYGGKKLGFNANQDQEKNFLEDQIQSSLKRYFKPEFLNRLDKTILFKPLDEKSLRQIGEKYLARMLDKLSKHGVLIKIDRTVINHLVKESYTQNLGARSIIRLIQQEIEEKLLSCIWENMENFNTNMHFTLQNEKIKMKISNKKKEKV